MNKPHLERIKRLELKHFGIEEPIPPEPVQPSLMYDSTGLLPAGARIEIMPLAPTYLSFPYFLYTTLNSSKIFF